MIKSEIVKNVSKIHLLAQVIFVISDLIQEMIKKSNICFWIPIFFVCIIPIWYLKKETQICNKVNISRFKFFSLISYIKNHLTYNKKGSILYLT